METARWIHGAAICDMAPGGRVFFDGAADWRCIYCDRPVGEHTLDPERDGLEN